jgi:hypothetical protein
MPSIAIRRRSTFVLSLAGLGVAICGTSADAQIFYGQPVYVTTMRPVVAAPFMTAPAYVANYTPAGNYAAVTAFSPPVVAAPMEFGVRTAYAPVISAAPVAVTAAMPVAPMSPVAVTSYYAPAPVAAAPITAFYAPAMVATPVYRRGLFGGYRPVFLPY